MYRIVAKEQLNSTVEMMEVHAPFVARKCEPGQFVMVRVEEGGERIPLTIADYSRERETVTIIYQVVGFSTKRLSLYGVGDSILDFAGPLGKPIHSTPRRRVLGIAGGVGAAPLYPQLRKHKQLGAAVDVILGGRHREFVILEQQFREFCSSVRVATNDGSLGTAGLVTDVFQRLLEEGYAYDEVIAIGPLGMMQSVVNIAKPKGIPVMVSLNPIMIDGTGMCGGCRVTVAGQIQFACVDGPDFDGWQVDFDECIRRQGIYKDMEAHACRVGIGG